MSLPAYLANIKSSGIYRFVWDKSEIPNTTAEILRLVVGYSERGPFNTPVYIASPTEFRQIFGGISKKLERQGCWFHRLALQALRKGPILCLNLKNFNNETVEAVNFNPQATIGSQIDLAVQDIYNTNRFWTLEPEQLEEITGVIPGTTPTQRKLGERYLTITATDSKDTSNTVFIRGYEPTGYDVTFKEWYSAVLNGAEMPSYLEGFENRKLKNFWAEIYVFRGQFTPDIASSDVLCKYFDVIQTGSGTVADPYVQKVTLKPYVTNAFGEKKDTLDMLAANDASNFIRKYQGILLPEFQSATGSTISLDILFNNDNQIHKMMMRLNSNALYEGKLETDYDFNVDDLDTMGWEKTLVNASSIAYGTSSDANKIKYAVTEPAVMSIESNVPVIYQFGYNAVMNEWQPSVIQNPDACTGNPFEDPTSSNIDKNGMPADFYVYDMKPLAASGSDWATQTTNDNRSIEVANTTIKSFKANSTAILEFKFTPSEGYSSGVTVPQQTITGKVKFTGTTVHGGAQYMNIEISGLSCTAVETGLTDDNDKKKLADDIAAKKNEILFAKYISATDVNSAFTSAGTATACALKDGDYNTITADSNYPKITIAAADKEDQKSTDLLSKIGLSEGDILWVADAQDDNGNSSPLCTVVKVQDIGTSSSPKIKITFDKSLTSNSQLLDGLIVKCVGSVTATSMNLLPTYIQGYEYAGAKVDQIPSNTSMVTDPQMRKNNWVNYQLGVLDMKGIREGLTNRIDVEYRYLVDTFESFAVPGECKAKLAMICKMKFNVLGLLNFPNMKSFSKCTTMSFKDSNGFDSKYIAMGGNPMFAAGGKFTLASEDNGASFVSYNTPLMLKDPETGVKTAIPPAGLVSNDYMDKFTKFLPYSIVAGNKRGHIDDPNLIGPEFSFGRYDLDQLEPMGVNCMVYVPGKGTYINSNQTAKQNPVTALSKIHVRELCTFLQDEIEKMMEDYHWDFNTPNLRQTLKDRADVICDTCYRNGGIYAYYNVCDESNNTPEIIDNEMIILATSIEPSRGARKMIQELTLYRTGGLQAVIQDAK